MMMQRTASHPFLLQLIASRLFENHDLVATLDQVASDEMVANFFSVDYQTLEADERAILEEVARCERCTAREVAQHIGRSDDAAEPLLFGLRMMGYLSAENGAYRVGNWFFERWLRRVTAPKEARA